MMDVLCWTFAIGPFSCFRGNDHKACVGSERPFWKSNQSMKHFTPKSSA